MFNIPDGPGTASPCPDGLHQLGAVSMQGAANTAVPRKKGGHAGELACPPRRLPILWENRWAILFVSQKR